MLDYQNGKIYMIYPKCEYDEGDVYYGSTAEKRLSARMSKHRCKYINKTNNCNSTLLFNKYGLENCIIELVEEFPCDNKQQLHKREGFYIKNNKCINKCIAGRNQKEWREDNKEILLEKKKKYYIDNKDEINKKGKEYREPRKEKINEKSHLYYIVNKDKINEKNKEKAECQFCSKLISQRNMKRHVDTIHSNS